MEYYKQNQKLQKEIRSVMTWQWQENGGKWICYGNEISKHIQDLKIGKSYKYTQWELSKI